MKKFISTLLILSTLSCFTTIVSSFANDSMEDSENSISYIYGLTKNKTDIAIKKTKYGFEVAYNWTTDTAGKALNSTTYGLGVAKNWTTGTAWPWIRDDSCDWAKNKASFIKNEAIRIWCEYIGLGCKGNAEADNQGNSQENIVDGHTEL